MCKTKSGKLISGGEGRWDPNKKGGPTKNPKINKLGGGGYYLELESRL